MPETLHASAVALDDRALLIMGPSGSGKSSLALELMAYGCMLVADDHCLFRPENGELIVSAPETIAGMIEARGMGILNAAYRHEARVVAVVDLTETETERYPAPRSTQIAGIDIPLIHNSEIHCFPAQLLQYLRGGRKL